MGETVGVIVAEASHVSAPGVDRPIVGLRPWLWEQFQTQLSQTAVCADHEVSGAFPVFAIVSYHAAKHVVLQVAKGLYLIFAKVHGATPPQHRAKYYRV